MVNEIGKSSLINSLLDLREIARRVLTIPRLGLLSIRRNLG